ncbi:MAG: FG-GAP-like repeat-containing protein [Muribaculum sp.]|nr:FG-GAP-like repeat-containing protein [Muribaculum sp.]
MTKISHRLRTAILIIAGAFTVSEMSSAPVSVWVDPMGNDSAEGSATAPYATLDRALKHIRTYRGSNPTSERAYIIMRDGTYYLSSALTLTPEDSNVTIKAADGASPVISGGLPIGEWSGNLIPTGLPEVSTWHVFNADFATTNGHRLRQLWSGDQKTRVASTFDDLSLPRLIKVDKDKGTLTVPRVIQNLHKPEEVEMTIIQDWVTNILRVNAIETDGYRSTFTFKNPESEIEFKRPWPILRASEDSHSNHFFYLSNAAEFLDHPGEWYHDVESGKVYYWSAPGDKMESGCFVGSNIETVIDIQGDLDNPVAGIEFQGIGFSHTTWYRPATHGHVPLQAGQFIYDAYEDKSVPAGNVAYVGRPASGVSVTNARELAFENCRFEHMGSTALDLVSGAKNITVRGCVFNDIGGSAILGGYFGDEDFESHQPWNPSDSRVVCEAITIDNNYIAHPANEDWGCLGVCFGFASEVTISHNEIFDTPYSAISVGWGWVNKTSCMKRNRIIGNYIHSFCNQMRDGAAIYTLSAQPGSVIEGNRIEDVGDPKVNPQMWDMRHAQFDLYLDEGSNYFTVKNNWLERGEISRNQNGPNNTWGTNGNKVPDDIKLTAGLEASYSHLPSSVTHYEPFYALESPEHSAEDVSDYIAPGEGFKLGTAKAVDLNGDGKLDIVFSGGESFQVQHGGVRINRNGRRFTATQGLKRVFMGNFAAGDLNGDGAVDLVQAGWDFWSCYNAVLMNDGKGHLTEHQIKNAPETSPACGIADINNDGRPDYFFIGNGKANRFYIQNPDGTFREGVEKLPLPGGFSDPNIIYADFNNDSAVDICILSNKTGGVFTEIFYNDGHGNFTQGNSGFTPKGTRGGMACADVNNDGYLDIVIGGTIPGEAWNTTAAEGGKTATLYLNDRKGGFVKHQDFSEYMFDNTTQPLCFVDWNNDGYSDLVITG